MTLPLSGLQPITESPLPSPSTADHLQQQDTPAMSPAMSNTARFAAEATSIETSAASSRSGRTRGTTDGFDVNAAYVKALRDEQVPHPLAAILALTQLLENSTATTLTGLLMELTQGRKKLVETQPSLGVRAGCQLFERFVGASGAGEDFLSHRRSLVEQGRMFCAVTAPECRHKIADLAIGFLRDDCVILTHSYSRTVMQALLRAHKQNKRIKVYVTEGRPEGLGMKTHQILTQAGIPCTVILDSAIAYILERVDIVLVGTEAVVESGGLVSSIGTSQCALLAKAMGKPFYALAESYKFLRYYPLTQSDLPMPKNRGKSIPLEFDELEDEEEDDEDAGETRSDGDDGSFTARRRSTGPMQGRLSRVNTTAPATPRRVSLSESHAGNSAQDATGAWTYEYRWEMTKEMEIKNPLVDITTPDLIDLVITDLGAMSPTSVSQYLVALFSS
ncbi:translation initiation factor eIF-2B subunit alpha [Naganishia albida]|nr:translation initiation factor eIF-2B subunit alpha [Naganishia albida]